MFLELKNIWISYKNFKILEKINFSFEKKWVYIIIWPSWSWKTTLLKIIWWFLKPDSGEIFFENKNLYSNKNKLIKFKQKTIWFSYQKLHLIDELSVEDNLILKAKLTWEKIDNSWKNYLIEYFEIKNLLEKKISEISWWQALRVSLIKSVLLKPKILLLDEPESWLDSKLIKKLQDFYTTYAKNNLVIISSHFLNKWQNENLEIKKI
jgi:ABC-type lipoprotein export system ATPase subunit